MSRLLAVLGGIELVSLIALLANRPLIGSDALASTMGPVHGVAYVAVIVTALILPASRRARLLALIPGVGGLLAERVIRRGEAAQA